MTNFTDFTQKFDVTVVTQTGLEKAVKGELKRLGYGEVPAYNGALTFSGDAYAVARLNMFLRSADRVYIRIADFVAESFDELFEGVRAVRWYSFLPKDARVLVNGKCVKSKLFAVSACQKIVKKAVSDSLCKGYGVNYLGERGEEYQLEFAIVENRASIYLNTSGVGLHKRGYRDMVGIAPIRETLASGMILLSDFYYKNPFADPFCGSGTIAVEGARIALNIAPGKGRKFAFNSWKNFDQTYFDRAIEEAFDTEKLNTPVEIYASDIDPKAVKLAKRHAERAGVGGKIRFSVADVKDFKCELKNGTIVTNPPYGERVYDKIEAEACYRSLGKVYSSLTDWSAFVITSAKNFEKHFGKEADKRRKLYNGMIKCQLFMYFK